MTDQEMLEELKNWDEESWKLFKQKNYETITLSFQVESPKDCMEQSDHDWAPNGSVALHRRLY